ncbi:MAG: hypothetical protein K1X53_08015 [Candidatus Sumerlaeaceae bacterium]|nr:hypothetical protein [Candidatus Sumerlaeaceae bacterium]
MKRIALLALAAASALLFAGCGAKEAIDYLPEGAAYFAVNPQQAENEAGAKRLTKLAEQLTGQPTSTKVNRIYLAVSGATAQAGMFGVMTGAPGTSAEILAELKKQPDATETKVDGHAAVTMQQKVQFVAVDDKTVLFCGKPADYETMQRTAAKKNPAAKASPVFQKAIMLSSSHVASLVINAEPLIGMAGPQLGMVSAMSPKGTEALKKVKIAAVTFGWDKQPKVDATVYLDSEDDRKELANLLNMGLGMAKMNPQVASNVPDFLQNLQAKSDSDGVNLSIEVPKEMADGWIDTMEKEVASLPKDPKERSKALESKLQEMVLGGMAAGANRGSRGSSPSSGSGAAPTMNNVEPTGAPTMAPAVVTPISAVPAGQPMAVTPATAAPAAFSTRPAAPQQPAAAPAAKPKLTPMSNTP